LSRDYLLFSKGFTVLSMEIISTLKNNKFNETYCKISNMFLFQKLYIFFLNLKLERLPRCHWYRGSRFPLSHWHFGSPALLLMILHYAAWDGFWLTAVPHSAEMWWNFHFKKLRNILYTILDRVKTKLWPLKKAFEYNLAENIHLWSNLHTNIKKCVENVGLAI
jgi:hypothetical protein